MINQILKQKIIKLIKDYKLSSNKLKYGCWTQFQFK